MSGLPSGGPPGSPPATRAGRTPTSGGPDADRREAALYVERGIERYAEGSYDEAVQLFEAALVAHPGHVRAVECLAWVREVAAGRRTLRSGTYRAVTVETPREETSREVAMPRDESGDSVTREWSSIQTGPGLPVLDVPELSEEQIANLLDLDGARGFTLSAAADPALTDALVTPPPDAAPGEDDEAGDDDGDEEERDRTNVRLADAGGQVVELVADHEAEEEVPASEGAVARTPQPAVVLDSEPALTPLASASSTELGVLDQTADEPPSLPTNPFVSQRLSELAPDLLPKADVHADPLLDAPPPSAAVFIEGALRRGSLREAFDASERLADSPDPRTADETALLHRVYEAVLGDLSVVPRYVRTIGGLDSRAAFLLSRMDGTTSADDLLDVSGMPRIEAMRVLSRLVVSGSISMKR